MKSKSHPLLSQRKTRKSLTKNKGSTLSTLLPLSFNNTTGLRRQRKKYNVFFIQLTLVILLSLFLSVTWISSLTKSKVNQLTPDENSRGKFKSNGGDSDTEALHVYADSIRMDMPANDVIGRYISYDIEDCPEYPPDFYPLEWNLVELLDHWNPKDVQIPIDGIYQGLCIFNTAEEAIHYRNAEVPFVIRKDPTLLPTVYRWNSNPDYLVDRLGRKETYMVEVSENNHLMFYRQMNHHTVQSKDWEPPIQKIDMTYPDWLKKADVSQDYSPNDPHYYFRVNAKGEDHFLYTELPFFKPQQESTFYMVNPKEERGINCRFGMVGNMAECHYDGSRNFITVMGGQRRYILSHPRSCSNLELYEKHHPSARHSSVDWTLDSSIIKERYPSMIEATANEVILQAGDVLYLPSFWFHTIISLSLNWQCNARSGTTTEYHSFISECGFPV